MSEPDNDSQNKLDPKSWGELPHRPSLIRGDTSFGFASPTTAINLETVRNSSQNLSEANGTELRPVQSNRESLNHSFVLSSTGYSSDENDDDSQLNKSIDETYIEENGDEEDLQNLLNGLMKTHRIHQHTGVAIKLSPFVGFNKENCPGGITDETEFYNKFIRMDKSGDNDSFHCKLKHFFILSSAGKPIYSLHGSDDIIMGYMGIITTIVSTFEENMKEEIKSITLDNRVKVVALNKSPIILVTISKIAYEFNKESIGDDAILVNQLSTLYDYLLSILSKPSIEKNFYKRLNYDLRKVLTPLDFHNLDSICMKSTFGLPVTIHKNYMDRSSFDFFVSELLNSSLQNIMITNTTRMKLNSIMLSCKKLKRKRKAEPASVDEGMKIPFFNNVANASPVDKYVGDELLFGLLMASNKLLSFMKPKTHDLSNRDLKMLFSMINSTLESTPSASAQSSINGDAKVNEDLWIPLCMPNFNPNGFLYIFVKRFNLADYLATSNQRVPTMVIILISGSKNSFFDMQKIASYLIGELTRRETFKTKLCKELMAANNLSIYKELQIPIINHFIYKLKKPDQFVMSDIHQFNGSKDMSIYLQSSYFYSVLHNTKAVKIKSGIAGSVSAADDTSLDNKRLTYINWSNRVVGFMLSDDVFEFYCLCNADSAANMKSKDLIMNGLRIIKWCEKNYRRLFIGSGVCF